MTAHASSESSDDTVRGRSDRTAAKLKSRFLEAAVRMHVVHRGREADQRHPRVGRSSSASAVSGGPSPCRCRRVRRSGCPHLPSLRECRANPTSPTSRDRRTASGCGDLKLPRAMMRWNRGVAATPGSLRAPDTTARRAIVAHRASVAMRAGERLQRHAGLISPLKRYVRAMNPASTSNRSTNSQRGSGDVSVDRRRKSIASAAPAHEVAVNRGIRLACAGVAADHRAGRTHRARTPRGLSRPALDIVGNDPHRHASVACAHQEFARARRQRMARR